MELQDMQIMLRQESPMVLSTRPDSQTDSLNLFFASEVKQDHAMWRPRDNSMLKRVQCSCPDSPPYPSHSNRWLARRTIQWPSWLGLSPTKKSLTWSIPWWTVAILYIHPDFKPCWGVDIGLPCRAVRSCLLAARIQKLPNFLVFFSRISEPFWHPKKWAAVTAHPGTMAPQMSKATVAAAAVAGSAFVAPSRPVAAPTATTATGAATALRRGGHGSISLSTVGAAGWKGDQGGRSSFV